MDRDNLDFLTPMFPFGNFYDYNILVINQTTNARLLKSEYPNVRVINSFERGLSKSRNLALQNAIGKIGIVADDDVVYIEGFEESIVGAFNQNKDAALLSFRTVTPDGTFYKKYPEKQLINPKPIIWLNIMSVEMCFNMHIIKNLGIKFNEDFGLGAKFPMGEEAVFINDLRKQALKTIMQPEVIVMHPQINTHSKITVHEKYYIQGALFTTLFGNNYMQWVLLKMLFEIKQGKIKLHLLPKAFKAAIAGRKALKESN